MRYFFFVAMAFVSVSAQASVITYTFDGQMTSVSTSPSVGPTTVQVGDFYTAVFVVNKNDGTGDYTVVSSSLSIEGHATANMQNPGSYLLNNEEDCVSEPYCSYFDEVYLRGSYEPGDPSTPMLDDLYLRQFSVTLQDDDAGVLTSSTSLPDFELSDFEGAWLKVFVGPGYERFGSQVTWYGSVDSLSVTAVPIPAAVWLFGSALAGLGWMRRK